MNVSKDSILKDWLEVLSATTEAPLSYQILIGLSTIGVLLKRRIYFDHLDYKVYPNMSVLLVGPSGIGKDTTINRGLRIIEQFETPPIKTARTIEKIVYDIAKLGEDPMCCLVPAPELTALLGSRDYQKGMTNDLTDILSTNEWIDFSTKGSGTIRLMRPTFTVWAGSTEKWLHSCMPEGAVEGGFLPRFVVCAEQHTGKHISMPKFMYTREELDGFTRKKNDFQRNVASIVSALPQSMEMFPLGDTREMYHYWYVERIKRFAPTVRDYAVRSRDHVLRLAMTHAVSRGKDYIDNEDVQFGIDVMDHVSQRLEQTVIMPTREAECSREMYKMIPGHWPKIYKALAQKYESRLIASAQNMLQATGQIEILKGGKIIRKDENV